MARKNSISLGTLIPLGVEKLAQMILDEAEADPAFRERVTAALTSTEGQDAVAKLKSGDTLLNWRKSAPNH